MKGRDTTEDFKGIDDDRESDDDGENAKTCGVFNDDVAIKRLVASQLIFIS